MNEINMYFLRHKQTSGFTLIEVMVVITIVGLLASMVLASLTDARAKARDAQRVQLVKELQKALELYRSQNNGQYPCATAMPACASGGGQVNVNGSTRVALFDAAIAPFVVFPNETSTHVPLTQGSILYRGGSGTGSATGTPNISTSYAIVLRRETAAVSSNGTPIPAGAPGCVIRFGPRSNTVNFTMPDC
jgi:prepilin-type N-terminal cleavage/methylation domain-containing protein